MRDYLDVLAASGALVDAQPCSFEFLGDCVIVSGALRLGRQVGAVESVVFVAFSAFVSFAALGVFSDVDAP